MKKSIYQFIFQKLMGWEIKANSISEIKKCIVICVPHTSWHDFYLGVFSRGILQEEFNFVAKKELFIFPLGIYFKWMGGAPLNRQKNENKVDSIAKIFAEKEVFRLAIAPEGTRKKVSEWKTGFYYIALKANVPIIPVVFDHGNKILTYGKPFYPTGNIKEDLKILEQNYIDVLGRIPEYSFTPKKQ
ncbi:1-acyl-sn-glycerol-3-phosphate acyltransferase [Flavobacterium sp.]|uniref:1-acyl-sn-glycerol-3-phosphate acyltransferase n=1 Tax=Flavobacterium sp. TaxID=239 RepID=UPI00286E8BEA|nr:1-acyl-sn-glycerol-3-phosphate acyltransferase [Flavobacterium sp.]